MTTPELDTDTLMGLQLKVARRADELAASIRAKSSLNLPCWLQAEEEVLGSLMGLAPKVASGRTHARRAKTGHAADRLATAGA